MCGITGFIGRERALPFLLQGLEKLEYRGYDSAGVTLADHDELLTYKAKGRLSVLKGIIEEDQCVMKAGIGHTRWATHGVPNQLNAHPHNNADGTISIVHNGIVENYMPLKEMLLRKGQTFASETDSEVIVQLLDWNYRELHDLRKAFFATINALEGSFAVCAVSTVDPDTLYTAKKESPMVLGKSPDGTFCASDATALLEYTKDVLPMNDGEIAVLRKTEIMLFDFAGNELKQNWIHIPYDPEAAQKGGYDSFMLKEIHEQPQAIRETLRGRLNGTDVVMPELDRLKIDWSNIRHVYFVACGTAYHACLYASTVLSSYKEIDCRAVTASEFRYGHPILNEHVLVIFVSQSGETADTIAALKLVKEKGVPSVAVTNVLGSSISALADATLYTCAGPEIAVASTKAYTTQLTMLMLVILKLGSCLSFSVRDRQRLIDDMKRLPELAEEELKQADALKAVSALLKGKKDAYFIGRQLDYPTALEGALKLKEVSYIHADAYYAGELKHGPIALIEPGTVVIGISLEETTAAKTQSNIQETVARGARVVLLANEEAGDVSADQIIRIPSVHPALRGILAMIPLQLLAYFAAVQNGCDIDKPRNLAKSVTVE